MAVYKIPQNVEADDKLIGPFSFRQFIYLIIVALAIAMGWGLSQLFIPLAILPLPIVIFFGALALPLRKDQPMEVYMAAVVSYYLKPRKRLWLPDGVYSLVEITAPKEVDVKRAKDLTQTEAEKRISYLADVADTHGWAVRHVAEPTANSPMKNDVYFAAQQTADVMDSSAGVGQSFETMINQADNKHHQELVEQMRQRATKRVVPLPPIADPYASLPAKPTKPGQPHYNPYPESIHQTVINPVNKRPLGAKPAAATASTKPTPKAPLPPATPTPITTSEKPVSPGIIELANNPDLSVETIAREAQRIKDKEEKSDEVVISLH